MKIQRNANRLMGAIFILTLLMVPNIIKSAIPEVKGLYGLFTPDVIGIGQALKFRWIENVFLYASKDNKARQVIEKFWHKPLDAHRRILEFDQLMVNKYPPVSEITSEILGKLLSFARDIREKKENEDTKIKIVKLWLVECKSYIEKEYESVKGKEKKLKKEKLEREVVGLEEENERLKQKQKENVKKIQANSKLIEEKKGTISTLDVGKNLTRDIVSIINNIEVLAKSQEFLPEMAESILWTFFDDNFESRKDLDECLAVLGKSIGEEKYGDNEYKKFDDQVKGLKRGPEKIEKFIDEYDLSTSYLIRAANTKIVPPAVRQITTDECNGEKINGFITCFETALLDAISILLFDPKNKVYDLEMLPGQAKKSELFIKTIEDVFEYKDGKMIAPKDIQKNFQKWLDIISNKSWFNYFKHEEIGGKKVNYDLCTTLENLVKVLDKVYNFELGIEDDPAKLEISIAKLGGKPGDAKDFWNKIFSNINSSKKLSTEKRKVIFLCELQNNLEFKILEDKVLISGSIGKVNVKIEYLEDEYKEFNSNFDINVDSGHAFLNCFTRGLSNADSFGEFFIPQLGYRFNDSKNKKMLPLSILLANVSVVSSKGDEQINNLICYCCELLSEQGKFEFIKDIIGIEIEDKNCEKLVNNLVDKITNNFFYISGIFSAILRSRSKIYNQVLIEKLYKKNPCAVLIEICKTEGADKKFKDIALKALDNPDIEISKLDSMGYTALQYAQKNKYDKIVEKILGNKNLQKFDKIIYDIRIGNDKEAIELIKTAETDADINGPADVCNSPLCEAAKKGAINVVRALLHNEKIVINKARVGSNGIETAIRIAVLGGQEEVVKLLLDHKDKSLIYDLDLGENYYEIVAIAEAPFLGVRHLSREVVDLIKKRFTENKEQKKEKKV